MNLHFEETTEKIIKAFYKVYNTLGYGFLEKVYENALFIELMSKGQKVLRNQRILVRYEGYEVGEYFPDLVVDDLVIVELKAIENLGKVQERQLLNYLKATDIEIGLLLNFGKKPEFRRKLFEARFKK
ncbi:MAG TPA: GxxExxY protein [Chitinophagaceae bacterium]|jgi:GxxExxY protein|nr:GxxExxY protein [Chitinophagaceae bacterium]HRG93350.1 GxxExxY protein [Chitinophagaceae bacterium]